MESCQQMLGVESSDLTLLLIFAGLQFVQHVWMKRIKRGAGLLI